MVIRPESETFHSGPPDRIKCGTPYQLMPLLFAAKRTARVSTWQEPVGGVLFCRFAYYGPQTLLRSNASYRLGTQG
jgi:hypothetical protein